jgi:purine-nucleoside phosphorylase
MFEEIHNDSLLLRESMDIPQKTLAVYADVKPSFETGLFSLESEFSFGNLPNFPVRASTSIPELRLYRFKGIPVLFVSSKPRLDNGYGVNDIAYGVRLLGHLGVSSMLIMDQAHRVHGESPPDDTLYLISDQVNFMGVNPLVGRNYDSWGPRFPDMSNPFDPGFSQALSAAANQVGMPLKSAVYAGFHPEYLARGENPLHHMERSGATLAGTALVNEVIVARHMGIRVCALAHLPEHSGVLPEEMLFALMEGVSGLG